MYMACDKGCYESHVTASRPRSRRQLKAYSGEKRPMKKKSERMKCMKECRGLRQFNDGHIIHNDDRAHLTSIKKRNDKASCTCIESGCCARAIVRDTLILSRE